jgi:hypothetical protein
MRLFLLHARRLPAQLVIYILGYLRRRRVRVLVLAVIIVGCVLVAIIFLFSFPSGENDGNFFGSLPVETTGVESPTDFKDVYQNSLQLFFLGHIYNVDIILRTITVSWLIGACGSYKSSPRHSWAGGCTGPNIPVSVYINGQVHCPNDYISATNLNIAS